MSKVILAFSGGLDTSFATLYLRENNYDVITVCVNTGGFSEKKLKQIEERAYQLGSKKHYNIDAQEKIFSTIIQYVIKFNALYQDDYPLMCADRYVIAEEILNIAKKENAKAVAHGSTSIGNDQVRFNSAFLSLDPNITILEPIKELGITRDKEIEYLEQRGFEVPVSTSKYSINENIFGRTVSGSEVDENKEPDNIAYELSKISNDISINDKEYVSIEFDKGIPVKIDGIEYSGIEMIQLLNKKAGKFGIGSRIYTGDCIIGIKGRIMFEAPGLFTLIEAHRKLQQLTLTKKQQEFLKFASSYWTDLVYSGLYFEPLTKNLEIFVDSMESMVSGIVKVKLQPNKVEVVEYESENSLIDFDIATYAQKSSWDAQQVNGFIKLYTLGEVIANKRMKKND